MADEEAQVHSQSDGSGATPNPQRPGWREPLLGERNGELATLHEEPKCTPLQAVYNLFTAFVGLGILTLPYALRLSGWFGIAFLLASILVFALTAYLMHVCLGALPATTPATYASIARVALGSPGVVAAHVFAQADLFGGAVMGLIIGWQQFGLLLPSTADLGFNQFNLAFGLSLVVVVPALFLRTFRELALFAWLGLFCAALMCIGTVGLVAYDPERTRAPGDDVGHAFIRPGGFLQTVGIYALSSSSHSSIPSIRASLHHPKDFIKVLTWMFSCILASYLVLSLSAYYYFGDSVAEVLTDSFAESALANVYVGHPALNFSNFLAACLGIKSMVMVLVSIMAQQKMMSELIYGQEEGKAPQQPRPLTDLGLRIVIFVAMLLLGLLGKQQVAVFESLLGGLLCLTCSLLLPLVVFAATYWSGVGGMAKAGLSVAVVAAVLLMAVVTTEDVVAFVNNWD